MENLPAPIIVLRQKLYDMEQRLRHHVNENTLLKHELQIAGRDIEKLKDALRVSEQVRIYTQGQLEKQVEELKLEYDAMKVELGLCKEKYDLSKKILALSVDVKEKYEGVIQKALNEKTIQKGVINIISECKREWRKGDEKIDGMTMQEIKDKLKAVEKRER